MNQNTTPESLSILTKYKSEMPTKCKRLSAISFDNHLTVNPRNYGFKSGTQLASLPCPSSSLIGDYAIGWSVPFPCCFPFKLGGHIRLDTATNIMNSLVNFG